MTNNQALGTPKSRKPLLIGSGVVVAALAVVAFVLPAEFGVDPLGTGKAFGLTKLSEPGMSEEMIRGAKRTGVLTLADQPPTQEQWDDRWEVTLAPYEGIELKYTLDEGGAMDFAWRATAPVEYDLHSHPFEGGVDLTEGYAVGSAERQQGRYVAAFSGLHGWFFQNRTLEPVTVTVSASGAMTGSKVYQSGGEQERPLEPARPEA